MKVLVTGASGFIGYTLIKQAYPNIEFIGTSFTKSLPALHQIDLTNKLETSDFLTTYKPDAIIHLAANGNVSSCESHPVLSREINVYTTKHLAEYRNFYPVPMVFASSDQVFNGNDSDYTDDNIPSPIHQYGHQKAEAEEYVLANNPDAVVLRLPLIIGRDGGHLKALENGLRSNEKQNLFIDEFRSPLHVNDLCQALVSALRWKGGIYNLPGPENLSRYELGIKVCESLDYDKSLITPTKQSDVNLTVPRPANLTMIGAKAKANGFNPKTITQWLKNS